MDDADDAGVTPRDRALYATAAAGSGVGIGASLIVAFQAGGRPGAVVSVLIWLLLLGALLWIEKTAGTAPEQFRRWARIGFGTSILLYLFAAMPWLNAREDEGAVGWGLPVAAGVVVAVPCLIAAAQIWTRRD